jgi:hypothetical protein
MPDYTDGAWVGPPPPLVHQPVYVNASAPRPFNHGPHVVADLLSCGFWIPVHLLLWALHRG